MPIPNFMALDEQEQIKIMDAVDILCKNNNDIVAQLSRLAYIKEHQPLIWKMALLKLNA